MTALSKSLLLFALNWLDAQLTIFWVRANLATEGNGLMAFFLDLGNGPFLAVKLLVGAFAAYLLYRCYHLRLAQRGLALALGVYICLMFVHAATGLSALGFDAPAEALGALERLPVLALALIS
jgi:hypothetical protein